MPSVIIRLNIRSMIIYPIQVIVKYAVVLLVPALLFVSCRDSVSSENDADNGTTNDVDPYAWAENPDAFNPGIPDDYSNIAHISNFSRWGSHNVHDPSLIKFKDTYYMFSTDVYYGGAGVPLNDSRLDPKIPIRKSDDLVHWTPIGHVFSQMPDEIVGWMIQIQPTYDPESVWAPFIMEVNGQFRLYFSVPANDGLQTAYIGLAVSSHPEGPWEHKGLVLPTYSDSEYNGIDPAVMIDEKTGRHWLYFGSWGDGIRMVELDPVTGFRIDDENTGEVVVSRWLDNAGSPPLEGAEVLYHPERDQYYIYVSYEPLMEGYNVRVGRADQPEGPYYDMFGSNIALDNDNFPRLTAQYRFNNHRGWQGVGHTGLLRDGDNYFLASQGRLGSTEPFIHMMNLHLRKMLWTDDGWPVLSPQRYASVPQDEEIIKEYLIGSWEHITLDEVWQKNESKPLILSPDNSIGESGSWSFENRKLTLDLPFGKKFIAEVMWGWDWENSKLTLLFTGLNSDGISEWGKKNGSKKQ